MRSVEISEEWMDWYLLTPQQRWQENTRLWQTFLDLGGSLEPEPDTDSPFFDAETWSSLSSDGRAGMRVIRRSGV